MSWNFFLLKLNLTLLFLLFIKAHGTTHKMLSKNQIYKFKQAKTRANIKRVFVFDDNWTRRIIHENKTDEYNDIKQFYLRDTYDNQRQFGFEIANTFHDKRILNILALAPTQSGKTGSMLAIIYEFTRNDSNAISHIYTPLQNIFIFTSHSSKEWLQQTKQRFPTSMHKRIFHRNQANQFITLFKGTKNAIIIFDECHIANKQGQTLYRIFCKLGLFNIKSLYQRNIKLIHFTATPGNMYQDLIHKWHNAATVLHMNVPNNYLSNEHYILNKQTFQVQQLIDNYDAIRQLTNHIQHAPAFHLIRTPRGHKHHALISQFKHVFKDKQFKYISEPQLVQNNIDFTQIIQHKPNIHTFIFIIDKIRCAKTIHIQHINIVYERFVSRPKHDTVLQGLAGRVTGYHKHTSQIKLFSFLDILTINKPIHKQTYNIFSPC